MPRGNLLLTVVATLVVTALLPLGVSSLLLETNKDALEEQVQRTHMVAASSSAARVEGYLSALVAASDTAATHPAILHDPRSPTSQELLRSMLQSQPEVVKVGIYSAEGELVVQAQLSEHREELGALPLLSGDHEIDVFTGSSLRWLRVRRTLGESAGTLILVAHATPLDRMVLAKEMGAEAQVILATRGGRVLAGSRVTLESFPSAIVERAKTGKFAAESARFEDPLLEDQIVGFAPLQSAPWFVLSRQPARSAEVAQRRIRKATWIAAGGGLALSALLSLGAWVGLVRPLRRLAEAQRDLLGDSAGGGGSEIAQLQASFEQLRERLRDSEELGEVFLGRYQVNSLVGSGAMGSVFLGWDPRLKRRVALKTIRLTGENLDRTKLVNSLQEEAATSARFNHPNVVTIYDLVAEDEEAAFIAMEYVEGLSLDAFLWDRGTLTADDAIPLALAVARALELAHRHGLVHHDVKPGNVLLGKDGAIKVTDFGISQLISAASKNAETVCGTPGYLAPECLQGEGYSPKSDLFSLGIILYEMLTGRHPFFGRTHRETMINTLVQDPKPIEALAPETPAELIRLVMALLEKDPKDRMGTAAEVVGMLEAMAHSRGLEWRLPRGLTEDLGKSIESRAGTQLLDLTEIRSVGPGQS